ncbi:Apyrase protein [Dioscorea alata]|uniref:Apyrase protein n=1 Tax=Dioscorea alata TaxID=55571 RepID=A0ACB7W8V4_DIOAL|nr:Apyrase protein [Dioscorea alata]
MRRRNARPQTSDSDPTTTMFVHNPNSRKPKSLFCRLWIPVAVSALIVVFLVLYIFSRRRFANNFGVIIDGGSTGTRIHVFLYRMGRDFMPEIDFEGSAAMRVAPGLSSFAEEPEKAGELIRELVEFGKGRVPRDLWGDTEVRLMATAGLRLLDVGAQERILDACRKVLKFSGFRFQDDWASVISGSDEGIYAWVAANYALGTLGSHPQNTTGIIELGGASAQVSFVSNEPVPPEFSHVLKFGEVTYNLYSHSFLHLGQNVAYRSLRELLNSRDFKSSIKSDVTEYKDPCTPKGYSDGMRLSEIGGVLSSQEKYHPVAHANGNFSECRTSALMLIQNKKEKCLYDTCNLGSAFIPKLNGRFLATENFFHTSKFFGLSPTSLLSDMMLAGERFCQEDWSKLKQRYHTLEEEDLLQYCFSSAYIIALLHDSLGIALEDTRIQFTNQVGGIPLDWALGAFIMQRSWKPNADHLSLVTATVYEDFGFLSLCIVSILLISMAWCASRWKKRTQMKTIYDMEKGRYIIRQIKR